MSPTFTSNTCHEMEHYYQGGPQKIDHIKESIQKPCVGSSFLEIERLCDFMATDETVVSSSPESDNKHHDLGLSRDTSNREENVFNNQDKYYIIDLDTEKDRQNPNKTQDINDSDNLLDAISHVRQYDLNEPHSGGYHFKDKYSPSGQNELVEISRRQFDLDLQRGHMSGGYTTSNTTAADKPAHTERFHSEPDQAFSRNGTRTKKRPGGKYTYPAEHILPPCKVCGDKASGYHFGAITCEACKVFFHRSLTREKEYRCRNDSKQCVLSHKRKPICGYCRIQRCRQLAMSKEGVKMGRYLTENRTSFILEANGSKPSEPPAPIIRKEDRARSSCCRRYDDIIKKATEVYQKYILYTREVIETLPDRLAQKLEVTKLNESLFGEMRTLPAEIVQEVFTHTGLDVDQGLEMAKFCMGSLETDYMKYVGLCKEFPGYKELDLDDKLILARDNAFMWFMLSHMPGFLVEEGLYACPSCECIFTLAESFSIISVHISEDLWTAMKKLKAINLRSQELALIMAITFISTDHLREDVRNQGRIDDLTSLYTDALVYHLTNTRRTHIITKIVDALTYMRNCNHIYRKYSCEILRRVPDFDFGSELVKELKGLNLNT